MKNNKGANAIRKSLNNVSLTINDVPLCVDVLTVALIVGLVLLVNSNIKVPEETKLAFLLALIVLISCYSVEVGIVVVIIAIVYVLVNNNRKNNKDDE